jgi:hypothetical protein
MLVVSPVRQGAGIFSSLAAAVAAAKAGDAIELDFDGRHEERPFTLSNIAVKIRAAEGRRPVIAFRPADADPVGYPRSMMTVAGGSLTIAGVQFELDVPRKIPGRCSKLAGPSYYGSSAPCSPFATRPAAAERFIRRCRSSMPSRRRAASR